MTSQYLTVECDVHFDRRPKGRKELKTGAASQPMPPGRVPRISKLMALAIRFDGLVRSGSVRDYAELARLGHVTRARVSQILSLVLLAPDIQEELLTLPAVMLGRDPIVLRDLLPIAQVPGWKQQRKAWRGLTAQAQSHLQTAPLREM